MEFRYEITAVEYVAGQKLYVRLGKRREAVRNALIFALLGLFLFIAARSEPVFDWMAWILTCVGIFSIYLGILNLYPTWYLRRAYNTSGLAGKFYRAELDATGFRVTGDDCGWQVLWQGVNLKGEDRSVFSLFAANTVFIFGKQYLTEEQQRELRRSLACQKPAAERTQVGMSLDQRNAVPNFSPANPATFPGSNPLLATST
jgi:hypothetical protein